MKNLSSLGNDDNIFNNSKFTGKNFYPTIKDNNNHVCKSFLNSYIDPSYIDIYISIRAF